MIGMFKLLLSFFASSVILVLNDSTTPRYRLSFLTVAASKISFLVILPTPADLIGIFSLLSIRINASVDPKASVFITTPFFDELNITFDICSLILFIASSLSIFISFSLLLLLAPLPLLSVSIAIRGDPAITPSKLGANILTPSAADTLST